MPARGFTGSGVQMVLGGLAIGLRVLTSQLFGAQRFCWRTTLWIVVTGMMAPVMAAQPAAPTNLTATATSGTQISLTWSASAARRLASYSIWRCQGKSCQSFSQIGSAGGSSTSYQDTGLTGNTTYRYRVRAVNTGGTSSSFSNTATATTLVAAALAAPAITSATTASDAVGTAFSYQITATNSPTGYGAAGLPVGLTINGGSGLISGTPTSAGNFSVTLNATNGAGTGTATLALTVSGSSAPAQIAANPSNVSFGTVTEGNTNSQTILLSNSGGTPLTFSQIGVAGSGFGETGLSTSTTIPAGGSTTFNATFDPSSASTASGSITLTTNGTPSPLVINLSGTGQAATVLASANPTSLAFGNVLDDSSSSLTTTLTSNGNSNVTISGVTVTSAGFSATGISNGTVLTPGQTATLTVTFAPISGGAVSGASVRIASNATNSPSVINLSGTGTHLVQLQWTASATSGVTYNIYRGTSSGGESTTALNSSAISGTTYADTNVTAGQEYYYTVQALDSGGSSAPSNEASAQIPTP